MSHVPIVLKSDKSVFDKMLLVDDNALLCSLALEANFYGKIAIEMWIMRVVVFFTLNCNSMYIHTKNNSISRKPVFVQSFVIFCVPVPK